MGRDMKGDEVEIEDREKMEGMEKESNWRVIFMTRKGKRGWELYVCENNE